LRGRNLSFTKLGRAFTKYTKWERPAGCSRAFFSLDDSETQGRYGEGETTCRRQLAGEPARLLHLLFVNRRCASGVPSPCKTFVT
jgi:hypothetical protein